MRKVVKQGLGIEGRTRKASPSWRQALYLSLSMAALLLSACFPVAEKQLLVLAIILGGRWIAAGRTDKINILIEQRG